MRFMIIVKATKDIEAGGLPDEKMIASMATYHEELAKAGRCSMPVGCSRPRRAGVFDTPGRNARWSMGRSRKQRRSSGATP